MLPISIVILVLISALVTLLFFGSLLCAKYSQNNIYKKFLLTTIAMWLVMLTAAYIDKIFIGYGMPATEMLGLLNARGLILGIIGFLSIVSLPIVVLNAKMLKLINWLKLASPIIAVVAIYFGYHITAGTDPFYTYYTAEELRQNITSTPVIMRILLYLSLLVYLSIVMYILNRVVPLYNQYIKDNIADSDYNVGWVSGMLKRIWLVTACFFIMLATGSLYVVAIYTISVIIAFVYIIDMSLFHKMMDGVKPLTLNIDRKEFWYFLEEERLSQPTTPLEDERLAQGWEAINEWLESEMLYTNPSFTINNVIERFSNLSHNEITDIFKLHGESFQSVIRKYRIANACRIIENKRGNVSSKQLYSQVGFSHHSSFSRAFATVQNISPSDYIKQVRDRYCDEIVDADS